jgi:tight adherence protein C
MLAPVLAAAAASTAVVAFGRRRPPALAEMIPTAHPDRRRMAGRVGSAGIAASMVLALACVRVGGMAVLAAPLVVLATLRAPVFLGARADRRRLAAIDRDVPLLLDVLSLASFAGSPPPAALERAVSAIDGPLADELAAALEDVELGARWRDRLSSVSDELPIRDLRRAIAVLVRTEAIGASSTEPIAILAEDVRSARRAAASERARKAPVQMLFPLVFLVLPAFLLLTVVPVLVATLGSIG